MKSIATVGDAMPAAAGRAGRPHAVREYRMPAKVSHWLTVALVAVMVTSGVTATQLGGGPVADFLFNLHKLTGAATLVVVLLRLVYRLVRSMPRPVVQSWTRPLLHWTLYAVIVLVPLLGWAGVSDGGSRDIFLSYALPPIWPEGTGWDGLLLRGHAYVAFALLALVALHIGAAMHDYMTSEPPAEPKD